MNTTSRQIEIAPAIRQHVADRFAKLEEWQTHLINPYVILPREPQGFVVDATINTPNGVLVTGSKHEGTYTVINELISKLERQFNKLQYKDGVRRTTTSVKDASFVERIEEEQSFILSASPARLQARFLLAARKQCGHCTKIA